MNALSDKTHNTQYAAQYQANKALIERARLRGHAKLRMPSGLENQFGQHFTKLSRNNFYSSFYFVFILLLLVSHLLIFGIEIQDFNLLLKQTLLNSFTQNVSFSGIEGMLRMQFFILLILLSLLYLPKNKYIKDSFQLFLSLSGASILALIMIAYALVDDERFLFTLEMELVLGYLFVFILLKLQVPYLLLATLLANIIFLISISILTLVPNWGKLIAISVSMNIFGIIYAYLREFRERELFLNLLEIKNERAQLEFLNTKTERDNLLKEELSKFYAVMSGEKNLTRLGEKILSFLIPELTANIGSLYFLENNSLRLIAQYGVAEECKLRTDIILGEGLLGQAALEKKRIMLDKSPEDFYVLQSGLGKFNSPALLIMPLMLDDEVIAVLEIASIKIISAYHSEFLDAASRSIAIALKAVAARTKH